MNARYLTMQKQIMYNCFSKTIYIIFKLTRLNFYYASIIMKNFIEYIGIILVFNYN